MYKKIISILIISSFILAAAGCATSIDRIKAEPALYVGSDVVISGEVSLEIPIPFMDYTVFQVDDATGRMFLLSSGNYHIGDRMTASARVIGITEKGSRTAAAEIKRDTADFLVKHSIAEPAAADKLSKKLFLLIAAFGGEIEGSYFLLSE
jgi:hypothetical protein